jgi:hypothetical protein
MFGGLAADNLSVVRAKAGVLRESNLGLIVTEGNPGGNLDNSLAGVDFQYHNTRLPGGRTLDADLWYQRTDTEGFASEQAAFGGGVRMPNNEGFRGGVDYREYERNFNPALGFVNRRNVSDTSGYVGYMLRPSGGRLQSWLINVDIQNIDYLDDGSLQTHALFFRPMVLRNRTGDQMTVAYQDLTERLVDPFEISPGILIPAGRYAIENWGIQFNTANHRKVSASVRFVNYGDGRFYSGDRDDSFVELTWRPSPRVSGRLSYDYSDIDLPQGSFETRLARVGLDFAFTSTISWVNLIQYDNVSETVGINTRLHWIPEAGREVYFVINHNAEDFDRDNRFHSTFSDVTAKLNYTFRF